MVFKLQSLIGWHTGHDYVKEQRSQVSINLKTRLMYISDTFSSFIEHIFINIPARIRIRIALSSINGIIISMILSGSFTSSLHSKFFKNSNFQPIFRKQFLPFESNPCPIIPLTVLALITASVKLKTASSRSLFCIEFSFNFIFRKSNFCQF